MPWNKAFWKKNRALGKAKPLEKAKLNKQNLEKLGSQTLDEKIKAAIEAGESEEHSAELLKKSLTKSEHSKVWSKRKIALEKASASEKKKHEQLSKKDKGLAASKWLLGKEGKKYVSALRKVKAEEALTRKEKWETEKQMLQKFSEEELQLHLQSGRVIWQECPTTWGAYEYKDLHDYEKTTTNARGKEWTEGRGGGLGKVPWTLWHWGLVCAGEWPQRQPWKRQRPAGLSWKRERKR